MAYDSHIADWPGSTSSSLLGRVKARNPEAWQRLVDLYSPLIYGWCRRAGLQPEDATDVVQEVFCAVLKGMGDFRGSGAAGSFRHWLWGIARHRLLQYFRDRQGTPEAKGGTWAQQQLQELPEQLEASSLSGGPAAEDALWRRGLEVVRAEFEDCTWQAFSARQPAAAARPTSPTSWA